MLQNHISVLVGFITKWQLIFYGTNVEPVHLRPSETAGVSGNRTKADDSFVDSREGKPSDSEHINRPVKLTEPTTKVTDKAIKVTDPLPKTTGPPTKTTKHPSSSVTVGGDALDAASGDATDDVMTHHMGVTTPEVLFSVSFFLVTRSHRTASVSCLYMYMRHIFWKYDTQVKPHLNLLSCGLPFSHLVITNGNNSGKTT